MAAFWVGDRSEVEAVEGDLWFDASSDQVYVCTEPGSSEQWVPLASGGCAESQRCAYCDSLGVSGALRCEACGASF